MPVFAPRLLVPLLILFLLRPVLASSLLPTRTPSSPPSHPQWQHHRHGGSDRTNHDSRVKTDDDDNRQRRKKKVGLILVDVHDEDEVGPLVLPWLQNKRTIAPSLPIELWTSPSTDVPEGILKILLDGPAGSAHRVMPVHLLPQRRNARGEREENGGASSFLRYGTRLDGFIGKAYALLHSHFSHAILLDADSWMCPGWEHSVFTEGNSSQAWNYYYQGAKREREREDDDIQREFPFGYEYNADNHTSAWDFRADVVWSLASFASQIYELTGFLVSTIPPLPLFPLTLFLPLSHKIYIYV